MQTRLVRYGDENEAMMEAGQQALSCKAVASKPVVDGVIGPLGPANTTETTLNDANMDDWIEGRFHTQCGASLMKELLIRPCGSGEEERLQARQKIISQPHLHLNRLVQLLEEAKTLEKDALWVLEAPELKKTWPLPFLFPTMFGLKQLNNVPLFHEAYHFCRLIASPALTILYPIGMILGPWIYLRTKMGLNFSFKAYIMFAYRMIRSLKGGAAIKVWSSLAVYCALYLYSIAQVVDLARMVGAARSTLVERHKKVQRLLSIADSIKDMCGGNDGVAAFANAPLGPACAPMAITFLGVWQWWGHPGVIQSIRKALQVVAVGDVVAVGAESLQSNAANWCVVNWSADKVKAWPRFYSMCHPALERSSFGNPAALDKNIILTGPNAAGKTTYCRGLLANVLLAQTLGIACARRATMGSLFGGIMSFMRISDETGKASLFEAEVARCVEMWKLAESRGSERVFMVLDEPMHATPPTEGAAAAMAFMKGLANMGNVRLIATTHYAAITSLAHEEPHNFINISMEAVLCRGKKIQFPYSLRKGPSYQSIALELMHEQGAFPNAFIQDALKIKEKIGAREIVATP